MIKKDFILRLVEELAKAIAKILHLLKDNDVTEAQRMYVHSFGLLKDIDEDNLLQANVEDFYNQLSAENGDVEGLFQSLSELLFMGSKIYKREGNLTKAKLTNAKALEILEYIDSISSNYSIERNNLMAQLRAE
ncbi:hypothetical protein [Saccharicrinis aurantiacus]|uniref:hypothetical protein n=1 Tax=Saccharicrinis aurantiacus TaxID=1849719 RepID=UPI0008391E08|nr:hypothetical protein [Saccharicrinis aurantiacus]